MLDIRKEELYITNIQRAVVSRVSKRYIAAGEPRKNDVFLYTISGSCAFRMADGTSMISGPGDVMYLACGADYAMDILTDEYHYIPCVFQFDTLEPCETMLIRPNNPAVFHSLFHKLARNYSVTGPGQKQLCMSLLYQICAEIAKNGQNEYMSGSTRLRIEKARAYIQSHITEPKLRVALLAKQAEMSEVHFRKLFAGLYRVTPSEYILRERVNYAKELMTLNELGLEDIAIQSGFSSLAHMCKVFKSLEGISPGAYRADLSKSKA
jgi:AraC-like DNA-binding protein